MDHDRFRARARDLRACAALVGGLTQMPDRATPKDFQQAADLLVGAADDLETLIKVRPAGCTCRGIQGDNYGYLVYVEGCLHHGHLYETHARLKADYEKLESALKNEARMKLVTAALTGAAMHDSGDRELKRAIDIADEALRLLARETT